MNDPTRYGYSGLPPWTSPAPAAGDAAVLAKVGGGLGLAGGVLVLLSLALPWWEVALFGSVTLWQIINLDIASSLLVGLAALTLLASGLLGLSGGVVAIALRAPTGQVVAGGGEALAGILVGLVLLYFLAGLYTDYSGLVGLGGGLVVAGIGCLLLLGGGLMAIVGAAVTTLSPGPPGRLLQDGRPAGYLPPVG